MKPQHLYDRAVTGLFLLLLFLPLLSPVKRNAALPTCRSSKPI